ncbi:DNA alkylation repair protein [Aliikangiella coralliicola]|uniref:DNA alkylation repair protein n=1 Tax=Aliikangiella coralliicola TaxID=2592383 RepID=A0A545UGK0_9GAMM|nr:DNA alkylation repair protein [Aliikangiella coralliicola]TQV88604.1 DNA alkylation repair protein [Aliikangiella coralliicola]
MKYKEVVARLEKLANAEVIEKSKRFFKSGKGDYGEHDLLLGITVPQLREQVKLLKPLELSLCESLLNNDYHEIRMFALLMLVELYKAKDEKLKNAVFETYLNNTQRINNWDLVDCSASKIVGAHLFEGDRKPLYQLAKSNLLWERRIAIVSTHFFIRQNDFNDTLKLAKVLINDQEDLMHKAVGWMLKEVGKREESILTEFLDKNYQNMPRTMLRTSIEKLPKTMKESYQK